MKQQAPPLLLRKLLKRIIAYEIYDEVEGDLAELFHERLNEMSTAKAKWLYFIDVLCSLRNFNLKRKLTFYNPLVMYKNYLKITFRNLLKYKGYSFINIFGLALGMASCLLILLFVNNELSFDGFHEKKANIYRLDEVQSFGAVSEQKVALSMYPMGSSLLLDYPEVIDFARFWGTNRTLLKHNNQPYYAENLARVDTSFLKMFDFKLVEGNKATVFEEPNNIIISESLAKVIFGNENPMGQLIDVDDDRENQMKVAGVFADTPDNSHLQFDALVSTKLWEEENRGNWGWNFLNTYIQLADNADAEKLEAKLDDFLVKYLGEDILNSYSLFLQPLSDVHLGSMDITHDYYNHKKFDRSSVNIFLILAFFVLLIASINFMNLSTARAATRSREVGVRKSIGAFKGQITGQFMMESIMLSFIALGIAFLLSWAAIAPLNGIIDRNLDLSLFFQPINLALVLIVTTTIGLLSGVYPALVMSGFNTVMALKGSGMKSGKSFFRNALVVFQYAIAITIIIGTVLATEQLNYMQNLDLGFKKDLVVAVNMYSDTNTKYDLLKTELMSQKNITNVTATKQRLGNNLHQNGMQYRSDTALITGVTSSVVVDHNFMDFYEMEVVEGRALSEEYANDKAGLSFVVNESLAKELGAGGKEVLGMAFHYDGMDTLGAIVGVVKNFNYNKLNLKVDPLFLSYQEWGWSEVNVKLKADNIQEGLAEIESVWSTLFPQRPFEYQFLDDHIDKMYRSEQQLTKVISILSVLAIIIASLGLFGLASFTVKQRLKEMGIRKVLGASVSEIVMILSKKFTALVLIAFLISAPITYYLMEGWLAGYAYSVSIGVGIFLIVGVGSWFIALLTVSFQSYRVASSNPVETLRIE
ncbi:ABC transporter permease [uncultured Roseivirga sp.]|uniref:ABC transporter permease n=1 Tax=uncultured Roseivirga sp. TaxID=543088 RepID=UPI0030D80E1B|tara:strand:- start:242812 stop:245424 length:2613 start_codon:yes stop_codon:yes gene_type:complete